MSGWRERSSALSPGNLPGGSLASMLGALVRLVLYRFLGARIMLALAVFGWLRRVLGGSRRLSETSRSNRNRLSASRSRSAYQPSQGESQTVHREPR
jgi:hypothetical protein